MGPVRVNPGSSTVQTIPPAVPAAASSIGRSATSSTMASLANNWRGQGTAIAIRTDEYQALSDFLTEVYGAWERLEARLELVRAPTDLRLVAACIQALGWHRLWTVASAASIWAGGWAENG
jgi:hypothetical protein